MKKSTFKLLLIACILFVSSQSNGQFKFTTNANIGQTLATDYAAFVDRFVVDFNTSKPASTWTYDAATKVYTLNLQKCQTQKGLQVNVYADETASAAKIINGDFECRDYGANRNPVHVANIDSLISILKKFEIKTAGTADSVKNVTWKPSACLFDVGGDAANQAFGAHPGMYKVVEYAFQFSYSGFYVSKDITFDIDTYNAGNTGKTATYAMTVATGSATNVIGTVDNIYVTGSGKKTVSVAAAIGVEPTVFANTKVYIFLKTKGTDSPMARGTYDPTVVFDNIKTSYDLAQWIDPALGVKKDSLLSNSENIAVGFLDQDITYGLHLQSKGRFGLLSIINDLQVKSRVLLKFQEKNALKGNDGSGNYTVDVPYTFKPAVYDKTKGEWSKAEIDVAAPSTGTVNDDLMFYFKATPTTSSPLSDRLEINNGTRFRYDFYYKAGEIVDLSNVTKADTLATVLAAIADGGTVILNGDLTYNAGYVFDKSVKLMSKDASKKAKIICNPNFNVKDGSNIGSIVFQNIEFKGDYSANYVFNGDKSATIGEIKFQSCKIHSLRGVLRVKSGTGTLDKFTISDCVVDSIKDYGVLSVDVNTWMCNNILFENSTFSKAQSFIVSKNNTKSVTINNCTINDAPNAKAQFLRWREVGKDNVATVSINNTIIGHGWDMAGTGASTAIDGFDGMVGAVWTVTNSYATKDFEIASGKDAIPNFPTTVYKGTAANLWVDPAKGDFHFADLLFTGIDNAGDPRWYGVPYVAKKIAYVTFDKAMDATAASPAEDPIIKMLKKDAHFAVNVMVVKADSIFSLDGYDALVVQEGFSSSAKVFTPAGSLGLEKIKIPFVYNKAYAFKNGKAITSATSAPAELAGELSLQVPVANQTNPLFSGISFNSEFIQLLKTGAADNGSATATKAYSYVTGLEVSNPNTLLAKTKGAPENVSLAFNDIPAGTLLGTADTLKARMITICENFGAICKDHGTNFTDEGLTIWRNAVYMASGINVPTTMVKNSSALDTLYASVGTLSPAFNPTQTSYELNLPTGTAKVKLSAVAVSDQATLTVPAEVNLEVGKDTTLLVVVENAIGNESITYKVKVHVILTGVDELQNENGVSVYPNPASNFARIRFTLTQQEEVSLSLYNIVGQKIDVSKNLRFNAGTNEIQINTESLKNGMYIFNLKIGTTITSGKLNVNR